MWPIYGGEQKARSPDIGKMQGSGEPTALFVLSWKSEKQFGINADLYIL